MLTYEQLLEVIPDLPVAQASGPWTRVLGYEHLEQPPPDGSCSTPNPLWPGGAKDGGARFTPKDSFDSLYLSELLQTAQIEARRAFVGRDGILQSLPGAGAMVSLSVTGQVTHVLDLTDRGVQKALGIAHPQEITGTWRWDALPGVPVPTQELGRASYDSGIVHGLRYPSAVDQGRPNLCVFTDRLVPNHEHLATSFGTYSVRLP